MASPSAAAVALHPLPPGERAPFAACVRLTPELRAALLQHAAAPGDAPASVTFSAAGAGAVVSVAGRDYPCVSYAEAEGTCSLYAAQGGAGGLRLAGDVQRKMQVQRCLDAGEGDRVKRRCEDAEAASKARKAMKISAPLVALGLASGARPAPQRTAAAPPAAPPAAAVPPARAEPPPRAEPLMRPPPAAPAAPAAPSASGPPAGGAAEEAALVSAAAAAAFARNAPPLRAALLAALAARPSSLKALESLLGRAAWPRGAGSAPSATDVERALRSAAALKAPGRYHLLPALAEEAAALREAALAAADEAAAGGATAFAPPQLAPDVPAPPAGDAGPGGLGPPRAAAVVERMDGEGADASQPAAMQPSSLDAERAAARAAAARALRLAAASAAAAAAPAAATPPVGASERCSGAASDSAPPGDAGSGGSGGSARRASAGPAVGPVKAPPPPPPAPVAAKPAPSRLAPVVPPVTLPRGAAAALGAALGAGGEADGGAWVDALLARWAPDGPGPRPPLPPPPAAPRDAAACDSLRQRFDALYAPHERLHALLARSRGEETRPAALRQRAEGAYLAMRAHLAALKAAVRDFEARDGR